MLLCSRRCGAPLMNENVKRGGQSPRFHSLSIEAPTYLAAWACSPQSRAPRNRNTNKRSLFRSRPQDAFNAVRALGLRFVQLGRTNNLCPIIDGGELELVGGGPSIWLAGF